MESSNWITWLSDWIIQYQALAGPLVFAIAFAESLALIGVILPGVAMLFAIGVLIGTDLLPLQATLWWCFAGAVCGDGISFALGYYFKEDLQRWRLFVRHPDWLINGHQFFRRHGTVSIILGRFIGPLRPIVPLVAGSLAMAPTKFYSINILSALAWAPAYLLPGFVVGASLNSQVLSTQALLGVFSAIAVAIYLVWHLWQRYPGTRARSILMLGVVATLLVIAQLSRPYLPELSLGPLWELVVNRWNAG